MPFARPEYERAVRLVCAVELQSKNEEKKRNEKAGEKKQKKKGGMKK
jgi:hypothetical protein